jgi:uncharacterized membrane protein YciS (DUF1049 family)
MFSFIISILTSKLFIANSIIGILLFEFAYSKIKPLRERSLQQKEIDKQYPEFQRLDLN